MGTGTTATIQARIDAQQTLDAIEYGIRSIKVCKSAWGSSPAHCAQITAGCQAATRLLGRFVTQDNGTLRTLLAAKKSASEALKAAKAEQAQIGNARQIRLALAA